jgi:hypothetical protein
LDGSVVDLVTMGVLTRVFPREVVDDVIAAVSARLRTQR